jgi:murein DD-endopeptidase MepM/ murein hydrolase activator NlpD
MLYQFPIDGVLGKQFKVTSPFGWRTHPTSGKKSHHNGVDLWASANVYNEAFAKGVVIYAGPSKLKKADGSVGGFGHHVMIRHNIDTHLYVSVYAHMVEGTIKVKKGDRVTAGTVLGRMGSSGDVTGKHLHFEIYKGKNYQWSANGSRFIDPIPFIKALIAKQKLIDSAHLETPEPVAKPAVVVPTPVKKVVK